MGQETQGKKRDIIAKTTINDSVFTNLFKDPEYTIQLYRALHPEDTTSTKADLSAQAGAVRSVHWRKKDPSQPHFTLRDVFGR